LLLLNDFQPRDANYRERVRKSFRRQKFMKTLGAELVKVEPGFCEIRLPYREALEQQHGFMHAGAVGAIADSAGGYAAYTLMSQNDSVLSVEYKLNLLEPAQGEAVIARGRVVRSGRTLAVCQVDVFALRDGVESLCATMQQTVMRLADRPDRSTAAT
jgi:uncharacterized protein (TIGR00369 family)